MKYGPLLMSLIGAGMVLASALIVPQKRLLWNRTDSAPQGLYWLNDAPFTYGDWVVVSASSDDAVWIAKRGYLAPDWPLLKRVAGMPGDEICRNGTRILIEGSVVGEARVADNSGRELPVWRGCLTLAGDEVFLLNRHPDSLDGRYFSATRQEDVDGVAVRLFERQRSK